MTRRHWPETLDDVLAEPVTPHCPTACAFRELCPTHIQEGIMRLFATGDYAGPRDCLWWDKMMVKVRDEFGPDTAVPTDATELRRLLRLVRIERDIL